MSFGVRIGDFRSRRRRGAAFRRLQSGIRGQLAAARRELAEFWADLWWRLMERLLRLLVRGSGRQRGRLYDSKGWLAGPPVVIPFAARAVLSC